MFSLETYKILHLLGVMMVYMAYGAALQSATQGTTLDAPVERKRRGMIHGIGLAIVLVGGFGMLARLGSSWPFAPWVFIKLASWLALGGLIMWARKQPERAGMIFWLCLFLGGVAVWAALYKPFS